MREEVVNGSRTGKSNNKMLFAIFGVLILLLAVVAGIFLVGQKQIFQQQAKIIAECVTNQDCQSNFTCINSKCVASVANTGTCLGSNETCNGTTGHNPNCVGTETTCFGTITTNGGGTSGRTSTGTTGTNSTGTTNTSTATNTSSNNNTSTSTAPTLKTCGQTCTQNSDCAPAGDNTVSVACINSICQNTACVGKTIPGANCSCSTLNACGQNCSASVGLCQAGSTCAYVVGPSCTNDTSSNLTTYCVPTSIYTNQTANWQTNSCVSRDQGNKYTLFNGQNPTVAQIQSACAPTTITTALASANTPAPTPSPSPTTTPTTTPTPTKMPIPVTGNETPLIILTMLGAALLTTGFLLAR